VTKKQFAATTSACGYPGCRQAEEEVLLHDIPMLVHLSKPHWPPTKYFTSTASLN